MPYLLRLQFECSTNEVGPLTDKAVQIVARHGGELTDSGYFFPASMRDVGFTFSKRPNWDTLLKQLQTALPSLDSAKFEHDRGSRIVHSYEREVQ
jgi:hypothetical protein